VRPVPRSYLFPYTTLFRSEIALRVDGDHGDAVDQRLLDQADSKAGLAAARHPDDHAVGGQIVGAQHHEVVRQLSILQALSQIEIAELLEIGQLVSQVFTHSPSLSRSTSG